MDAAHPGWVPGAAFAYRNYLYRDVEAVEAVGPLELEIRLSRPNASMLRSLAIFPVWLVSPRSFEDGVAGQRRPIGTGPYRFAEWRPNEAIVLERDADYWAGPPAFERLIFKMVPDNTARLMHLRSGDSHGMDGLQPLEAAALRRDERFEVHAADYPIPPGFLGYQKTEEAEPVPLDLERARVLIEPHLDLFRGRPLVLRAMNAPRPYTPDPMTAATFLQGQIQALGIEVRVLSSDFKSHLDALRNGDFEIGLIGWVGDDGDTDNLLSIFRDAGAAAWARSER